MTNVVEFPKTATRQPQRTFTVGELLALLDEQSTAADAWVRRAASEFQLYQHGELDWTDVSRRCIVHGHYTDDRIRLAWQLADSCRLKLLAMSVWEWLRHGEEPETVIAAITGSLDHIAGWAPCVLYIDELDRLNIGLDTNDSEAMAAATQVTAALVRCLERMHAIPGLVVVAACTRPERLEPELLALAPTDHLLAVDGLGR